MNDHINFNIAIVVHDLAFVSNGSLLAAIRLWFSLREKPFELAVKLPVFSLTAHCLIFCSISTIFTYMEQKIKTPGLARRSRRGFGV